MRSLPALLVEVEGLFPGLSLVFGEDTLQALDLESVARLFEEIIVVDTGSTDRALVCR
jgi:hypothetical protein